MSTTDAAQTDPKGLTFEAPGPGSWARDLDHQTAPVGRLTQHIMGSSTFEAGFRDFFGRYGLPLETMQARYVHGWAYSKPKIAAAPDKGGPPPPDIVLKLVTRLHPEMRRRNRAAQKALKERTWLADARVWHHERPRWIERAENLLTVELDSLDDAALREHLDAAITLASDMMRRHFELLGPAVAIGRLLIAGDEWGLDQRDVFGLLRGSSPASAATLEPLRAMAVAVAESGKSPTSYSELCNVSPRVAAAAEDYLHQWGWRVLSDDLQGPTLATRPDHLISLIAAAGEPDREQEDPAEAQASVRAQVPAHERDRFDELVAEAHACYPSLDDNSGVTSLTSGVAKRAILAASRRLQSRGTLASADDVWNLSPAELSALLTDSSSGPSQDALQARSVMRKAAKSASPPVMLGDQAHPPPDPSLFPSAMAEMTRAVTTFIARKFTMEATDEDLGGDLVIGSQSVARGTGIGSGSATGRVVVAAEVDDALDRLEPGDILVCAVTSPAWNSIFPLLSGIVTSYGGPLGHTAVMAREFGIPALVGVGDTNPEWDGKQGTIRTQPTE